VGLDDSEFTTGTGNGKVHFYVGAGDNATNKFDSDRGGESFSKAKDFWATQANLMKYDIVILSCEGITAPNDKPPEALAAMKAYADAGGRLFASHWHRYWFYPGAHYGEDSSIQEPAGPQASPFEPFATWNDRLDPCKAPKDGHCSVQGTINTSFPKG